MHLACPTCTTTNRVPDERLNDKPVCGRCGAALLPDSPVALDDSSFGPYVQRSGQPVLVDFWADWCGPCKAMAPQFAQAARQMPGVRFAKVDTESSPRTAAAMAIRSIPTLALFVGGREVARRSGAINAAELQRWVQAELARPR